MRLCVWSCLSCGALFNNLQTELFCLSKFFLLCDKMNFLANGSSTFVIHFYLRDYPPLTTHFLLLWPSFTHSPSFSSLVDCGLLQPWWIVQYSTSSNIFVVQSKLGDFVGKFPEMSMWWRGERTRCGYPCSLLWFRLPYLLCAVGTCVSLDLSNFSPPSKKNISNTKEETSRRHCLVLPKKTNREAQKKRTPKADASNDAMETLMHALYSHYIPLHFSLSLALLCPSRTYALKYFSPRTTSFSRPPPLPRFPLQFACEMKSLSPRKGRKVNIGNRESSCESVIA